ncbi:MAG: MBL fold metallo-hydrolase [Candidatus Lokiarchaeota archaeon]|nr:MBL fold metallo-hydrolase [Candidatus Lokiarchaeota archaeon]
MLKTQDLDTRGNYTIKETSEYLTIIGLKSVNCYLLKQGDKYILIDSGLSRNRVEVEKMIEQSGCKQGDLKLILATHGDPDHAGNCAYIRNKYSSKIAMHYEDLGMVELGDFTWNRNLNLLMKILGKVFIRLLGLRLKKEDRFKPDIILDDGQSLNEYGFNITVYNLPGHSKGSLGFLTSEGDFFCGDLLMNKKIPTRTNLIVDKETFERSIDRLKMLDINMVYPGHGNPFPIKDFLDNEEEGT